MSGKMAPAEDFYAEVVEKEHNRIYVFTSWATFDEFVKLHVDNFRYSDIGAGPNGETVVYVLTKKTSKQKPVEAMKKFNTFHGIQNKRFPVNRLNVKSPALPGFFYAVRQPLLLAFDRIMQWAGLNAQQGVDRAPTDDAGGQRNDADIGPKP